MLKNLIFNQKRIIFILIILIATVGCDQLVKGIARDTLKYSEPIIYLGGMIRLEHAENTGAFLSLGSGLSEDLRHIIFTVFVGVFLLFASFYLFKKNNGNLSNFGLSLLIGGGIGNLIDRVFQGSVTDYISVGIGPVRTGIFNIADVAILTGVGLLILESLLEKWNNKDKIKI